MESSSLLLPKKPMGFGRGKCMKTLKRVLNRPDFKLNVPRNLRILAVSGGQNKHAAQNLNNLKAEKIIPAKDDHQSKKPCFAKKVDEAAEIKKLYTTTQAAFCQPIRKETASRGIDWNDKGKMVYSKRMLHKGYEDYENKKHKVQLLDIRDLPLLPKQRNFNQKKSLLQRPSYNSCRAF